MPNMSMPRVEELLRAERKLNALEAAGVDNWEGYGYALHDIINEEEIEQMLEDFVSELHENILVENVDIDQPAGVGAGYSITIDEEGVAWIKNSIRNISNNIETINKREKF